MVADLDYLSGGRVDFGVGIGWLKEEFANLGMDFFTWPSHRRVPAGHESSVVRWNCRIQWSKRRAQARHFNPKPVRDPSTDYFGGESEAAVASRAW